MNYYKLYFTILLAGLTLFFIVDNVYKYRISKAETQAIEFLNQNMPTLPTKKESFNANLQRAMEKQKRLQKTQSDKNKEKLVICNYFTDIFKAERSEENRIKYLKACDPQYNQGQTVIHDN